ncbi:MAG: NFACT RNA binding domain-containing protein [Sandaracinus sp.]
MSSTTTRSERLALLEGARIRRIDLPEPDLACLSVALDAPDGPREERALLLSFSPSEPGVGLARERPRGAPASAFCQLLRKHLEGAVLVALDEEAGAVVLRTRRGPEKRGLSVREGLLVLEVDGRSHTLRAPGDAALGLPRWHLPGDPGPAALEAAAAALLAARAATDRDDETHALLAALRKLLKRLEQRVRAVQRDLARSEDVPELRARGTLVLSSLASIPRGASQVTLLDPSGDPPREIAVTLDPARDPREQARAWFDRARKLERGEVISRARLAQASSALARAEALVIALAQLEPPPGALDEARALVQSEARSPREASSKGARRGKPEPRVPYRRMLGHGDREIRVGRGARDNDELTQKHAAPHDLWLHARGVPGAHVVVPLARGESCPPELLLDAATLAAHFSDHAHERVVEVDYVSRGHVRKRKGMPPGKVELDHPKTLAVRMEPRRLERLLGRG